MCLKPSSNVEGVLEKVYVGLRSQSGTSGLDMGEHILKGKNYRYFDKNIDRYVFLDVASYQSDYSKVAVIKA